MAIPVTNSRSAVIECSVLASVSDSPVDASPPMEDSVARIITAFEKRFVDYTETITTLERENATLRERLITVEARSAEVAASSETERQAQAARISGLTEKVAEVCGKLAKLQKDVAPILERHYDSLPGTRISTGWDPFTPLSSGVEWTPFPPSSSDEARRYNEHRHRNRVPEGANPIPGSRITDGWPPFPPSSSDCVCGSCGDRDKAYRL